MPLPWALRGLRDGVVTTSWPRRRDPYFDSFPATVDVIDPDGPAAADLADSDLLSTLCPSRALSVEAGRVVLDRGRCVLCGRCVAAAPGVFAVRSGADTATLTRSQLLAGSGDRDDDDAELERLRRELAQRVRRLRRSLHIRHIDTGSDGSDEWEVQALLNPVYDIHRLGIFFTASPRHADILLVTGIGTAAMAAPLERTRAAMPDPVIVIGCGTDAISGGLIGGGYTGGTGVAELATGLTERVNVDIWVPGSPPSPFSLLHAILLAVDRVDGFGRDSSRASAATAQT